MSAQDDALMRKMETILAEVASMKAALAARSIANPAAAAAGQAAPSPAAKASPRPSPAHSSSDTPRAWSEEELRSARPAIYPHTPRVRKDFFETVKIGKNKDLLDSLQLSEFQGMYNLAAILLVFSLAYIAIRNVMANGLRMKLSQFTCNEASRDWLWALAIIGYAVLMSLGTLMLYKSFAARFLHLRTLVVLYTLFQCGTLAGPITFIYMTPMAPLPSAVSLSFAVVVVMKCHSFFMTNHALHTQNERLQAMGGAEAAEAAEVAEGQAAPGQEQAASAEADAGVDDPPALQPAPNGNGSLRRRPTEGSPAGPGARRPRPLRPVRADENGSEPEEEDDPGQASPPALSLAAARAGDEAAAPGTSTRPATAVAAAAATASNPALARLFGSKASQRHALARYPANLHLRGFLYFLAAPTLVYEPNYPRTRRVRWEFVGLKAIQLLLALLVQHFLLVQFLLPVLSGKSHNPFWFDLMKLAIPSFLAWLAGFLAIFHCLLNITGELLRFGDRSFFRPWWNATDLGKFWAWWNLPVHEWALRHCYVESQEYLQASRGVAVLSTFLISAVLHEVIFSVSFKTIRPFFFLGMLMQVPLIYLSQYFRNTRRGNWIVWLSLFLGQPLLELLYFRSWFEEHEDFFCVRT